MLNAISPIDGRYKNKVKVLEDYFSEYALIKYRVKVEILYLKHLISNGIGNLQELETHLDAIVLIGQNFSFEDAQEIKSTEKITNHDVKAVEYFVKNKLESIGLQNFTEWVHFALTSQDINNTAIPWLLKDFLTKVYYTDIENVLIKMKNLAIEYHGIPMLARTHGQPASPTTVGKEIRVFVERIENQLNLLKKLPIKGKFGGATGNFNAHKVSLPNTDWKSFGNVLLKDMGIERSQTTTQIAHYDHIAAILHNIARINTILIDFARDMWTYISMDYFKQKVVKNEVGSSAMPHKVNPIDFENAEGNLGVSNALLKFLAEKLPVSRLQRDLTDSTVLRNLGVPFAHTKIAFASLEKGLGKVVLNQNQLEADLERNWAVVAEAIQNILRRESFPKPYEALKSLTRGNEQITKDTIHKFIDSLAVDDDIKIELKNITPHNYVGYI